MQCFDLEKWQECMADSKASVGLFGIDEVGRGPLAGPVVAASALLMNPLENKTILRELENLGITDSKKLSSKRRRQILDELKIPISLEEKEPYCSLWDGKLVLGLASCSAQEIDEMNILQSALLAMWKSYTLIRNKLQLQDGLILIDGNKPLKNDVGPMQMQTVVKGDQKSLLIALASIWAKEYRDHLMVELADKYPGYGLEKHAGYPTKAHYEALRKLGPSPVHRLSFKGVLS